jgi:anti-anti-sigma factor
MIGALEIEHTPGVEVLVLRGEHDLSTQSLVQRRIDDAIRAGKSVVVDLSQADFIDSTVLAAILHGQQRAASDGAGRGPGLAVVASPAAKFVARMLSLVHLEEHVSVHLSRDSAVVSLQRRTGPSPDDSHRLSGVTRVTQR